MVQEVTLNVNGEIRRVDVDPDTPLLYVLRNDLHLKGPKMGCGGEQCNACKVLIDGKDTPSCQIPVRQVAGLEIVTIEGLGTASQLHPLQESFIQEQAIQCGYCVSGMIIAAQGLLNRVRYPTDSDIREALSDNICRCGVHDRVRRAIKMRIGRGEPAPLFQVVQAPALAPASSPADEPAPLPPSLQRQPDLDAWIRIDPQDTVTIFSGKAELGQGIKTALAQIAAEELDVALSRIRVITADTELSPDEGVTAGSMSVQISGSALRAAAAEARHLLLLLAFEELEATSPLERLSLEDGIITDPATGRQTTYWAMMGGKRFGREITGIGRAKTPSDYRVVGQPVVRLDLISKVTGAASFIHDLELPGMVHARVVRPPAYDASLRAVDKAPVLALPGVIEVVQDGSFLAVIAQREDQVVAARALLREKAEWVNQTDLPSPSDLYHHLLTQPAHSALILNGTAVDDLVPLVEVPDSAARTLKASYFRPYQMHGSLAPSAAVAQLIDGKLTVWSHSQGVNLLQKTIAQVLGMEPADIHLIHAEGSGCYGHNGADDAALDAALLARATPGRPVSMKWTREDEHKWEPYGTAMAIKLQASLDAEAEIVDWHHDVWSYPHTARPRPGQENVSGLLAARYLTKPFAPQLPSPIKGYHFGEYRNADPLYTFPRRRIVAHFVPNSPLRTSSMRALGAYANVFAIESFVDELALAAGRDPVALRLDYLADERARAVIEAAAEHAGWQAGTQASFDGRGRGFAFARYKNLQCYAAVIVDLEVDLESGAVQLKHAVIAADAGQIINPDGLSNQLEGGFIQSASWTLHEEVRFSQSGVLSQDWDSYPTLRFPGMPVMEVVLVDRPNSPSLGSGEAVQGPAAAAIANAIYDAAGVRMRQLPLTADKIRMALAAKRS